MSVASCNYHSCCCILGQYLESIVRCNIHNNNLDEYKKICLFYLKRFLITSKSLRVLVLAASFRQPAECNKMTATREIKMLEKCQSNQGWLENVNQISRDGQTSQLSFSATVLFF